MTKNIIATSLVAIASTALLVIVSEVPARAASFNLNFPLIDDFDRTLGTGSVKFEAEADSSKDWEKFAVTELDVNLTLTTSETFSFIETEEAKAVFSNGEFSGIEYRGNSLETDSYVLLIDGGDEAIKPGEPGAWSIWGPNAITGEVDTRITGGNNVAYTSVPEPNSFIGLGILSLSLLCISKKVKPTFNK